MGQNNSLPALAARNTELNIPAFMGKWFVIACKPTPFEIGAHNAIENYTWNEKKKRVDIDFTYNDKSFEGKSKSIKQKGFVVDGLKTEWKVSPFWPLKLPYIVLECSNNSTLTTSKDNLYEYCVIGYPSRAYLWIMAREKQMDDTLYGEILERLQTQHLYDLDGLYTVPHS